MALRFDLTVPLARYIAMYENKLTFPFKRYNMSKVYRGESASKGRFREFYQCDIDVIGRDTLSLEYDAEIPNIIYDVFDKLDIHDFVIRINNRKILNGYMKFLMKQQNVPEEKYSEMITNILRIIDKNEKIDITEQLGIYSEPILKFIKIKTIKELQQLNVNDDEFLTGIYELDLVTKKLSFPNTNWCIDLSIARGLDYYTGTVYETMIISHPEFGSVCSGGRFDDLVSCYSNKRFPGVGISIGLTRLFDRFKDSKIINPTVQTVADGLILPDSTTDYSTLAKMLRRKFKIDVYLEECQLGKKMKYASKISVKHVIIIKENNTCIVKEMKSGYQEAFQMSDIDGICSLLTK